jgi:hypothetical protein
MSNCADTARLPPDERFREIAVMRTIGYNSNQIAGPIPHPEDLSK